MTKLCLVMCIVTIQGQSTVHWCDDPSDRWLVRVRSLGGWSEFDSCE